MKLEETDVAWYHSELDPEKKTEMVDQFQGEPKDIETGEMYPTRPSVMILHTTVGATGITLTKARLLVKMEPDPDATRDSQTEGRIYREGQAEGRQCWIISILAPGFDVEELALEKCKARKEGSATLLLNDAQNDTTA